mgnify:CR=1 FL=1
MRLSPLRRDGATFVALVTDGQPEPPAYFGHDAGLNRRQHPLLHEHEAPTELDLAGHDAAVAGGAVSLDVRSIDHFTAGHLAGSLSVSLSGRFAEQAGSVVPVGSQIVLVGSRDETMEAHIRLARIGFDDVAGALVDVADVLAGHPERAARLSRLTAEELAERRARLGPALQFVDVRNPGEVAAAPVEGATPIPLARLREHLDELDRDAPVALVCAGGARSAVASSLLSAEGFTDVSDVLGGAGALHAATP